MTQFVIPFRELRIEHVPQTGGKNASLGEMLQSLEQAGVRVPDGFATTADAYREFLAANGLDKKIHETLSALDIEDVKKLAETGAMIRQWVREAPITAEFEAAIDQAWKELSGGDENMAFAVRSSATAEDLPDASFAGQQETFLNVRGRDHLFASVKDVFASLYNDRAIAYRVHKGFKHEEVALSAGVQRMVRSETGASGVMFTIDTESGFDGVVFITGAYGLGETVVQGAVNPDEFYVFKHGLKEGKPAILRRTLGDKKIRMVYTDDNTLGNSTVIVDTPEDMRSQFCINDEEAEELGRLAVKIEEHYGRPMDIEWARDGDDGKLYIVQARPETVKSQQRGSIERYLLGERGKVVSQGRAIGHRIGSGTVQVVEGVADMYKVNVGDVLVTDMTDPDWEPVMKRASAIVTNRGGRTCHAAIIARELGIPAVVGCGDATEALKGVEAVTVSCSEGDTGFVYEGKLQFEVSEDDLGEMPDIDLKLMMNVGNPERAFDFCQLPNKGVGLARLEFIINQMIGVHPKALINFDSLPVEHRARVAERISGYPGPREYFVARLVEGVATIAAAFYPKPVIVRMSDFKSNEYAHLLAGDLYEPNEENPMIGFRGASRYIDDSFADCFEMECEALKYVRESMGLDNVELMVPFVRTVDEARAVVATLENNGLKRGENGLRLIMMCEIPSNPLLADQFLEHFDGYSIGSNDLTQLTLGLDRDSGLVADSFDERNDAVKALLSMAIKACNERGKYVGICGQGPSDHPDLAQWLVDQGIQSMSLNPDTVVDTWMMIAKQGA